MLDDVPLGGGPVQFRGAVTVDETSTGWLPRRLGAVARSQLPDDFMRQATAESAGIRLAFSTTATAIELDVHATRMVADEACEIPASWYDLTVDGELASRIEAVAGSRYLFAFDSPDARVVPGPARTVRFEGLPGRSKEIEIWLPFTDRVEVRGLRTDAPVAAPAAGRGPRWMHHGSSISHGYRADHPSDAWPAVAAMAMGADLTNLAFSGNAMLDQLTARTMMRDAPADVISVKIGINLVNGDAMRLRAFRTAVHGFLDTLRDGHPSSPLLVISPIFCAPIEDCAGPTIQDPDASFDWCITAGTHADVAVGKLSLRAIRAELAAIVALRQETDPALHYLDGLALYGQADAVRMPLPDNLHPGPDVHRLIGERFSRLAPDAFRRARSEAPRVPTRLTYP